MTEVPANSGFRWRTRYPQYCVTVVEDKSAAEVLAGFGAVAEDAVRGGPREAAALTTARYGYRPVIRAVAVGHWVVVVEERSLEGVRPEVLCRLSATGRAVSVGTSGDGMRWLGYGENGTAGRVETASAGADGDREWDTLRALADQAGVSLADWAVADLPASSLRFVAAVCGFAIDDEIVGAPGLLGVALPVLPRLTHAPGAPWAAALRSVPDTELAAVATRHTRDLLAEAGMAELAEVPTAPAPTDESATGVALRELIARELVAIGTATDPNGPPLLMADRIALHRQAATGRVAHALLAGGPRSAIQTMLEQSRFIGLSQRHLFAELGIADQDEEASHQARRARSIPVDQTRTTLEPESRGLLGFPDKM
ncbi:DUF6461 domain-containing protein [Actinophytocola sediminis]